MSRPVNDLEAQVLSNKAREVGEARLELAHVSPRFSPTLLWMVPGLVVLAMGESLQRSLGVTSNMIWLLGAFAIGGGVLAHRVAMLERRVRALTLLLELKNG